MVHRFDHRGAWCMSPASRWLPGPALPENAADGLTTGGLMPNVVLGGGIEYVQQPGTKNVESRQEEPPAEESTSLA